VHRFLHRAWRLAVAEDTPAGAVLAHLREDRPDDEHLERALQRTIHKVEGDIARLAFNTAIAAMMIFVNDATKAKERLSRSQMSRFVQCLQPFAPHIAEELWQRLGHRELLAYAPWPAVDPRWLVDDAIEVVVQVLGKKRAVIQVAAEAAEPVVLRAAREAVREQLAGKTVVKEIVVPKKLVNFVVK
jgi:leucyl-tRNA synthetase